MKSARSDELESARARHHGSLKDFACFLSHDDQFCATEAEKLKVQLESLLDANIGKTMLPSHTVCAVVCPSPFSAGYRL